MRKIVITGGHLTPAIATIQELKSKKENPWKIYYFGRKVSLEGTKIASVEAKIIPDLGVIFVPINPGRWQRRFSVYTLASLLRVPWGFFQATVNLFRIKPDLILSFGSYVSTPVVIAGWLMGIPIVSHEQTPTAGLANAINSRFSARIAVSLKESLNNFPSGKAVFTGNPLRKEIFVDRTDEFTQKIKKMMARKNLPLLYITGGNQGSAPINKFIADHLPCFLDNFIILHQTGSLDYPNLIKLKMKLINNLRENYFLKDFISLKEIGWVFKNALLVVSRSGANICYELGCLGKPAILIPLPFSFRNEQFKNAARLKDLGLAEILEEDRLNLKNFNLAISRLTDKDFLAKNLTKLADFYPRDGAEKLVKIIEEIYKEKIKKTNGLKD